MVLHGCKQAGGIRGECARWTIGEIEIQDDFALLDRLGVQVPAGRVGLPAAGQILELEKQFVVPDLCNVELVFFAIKGEGNVTIQAILDGVAKYVWLAGGPGLRRRLCSAP